jgi:hypothetical protein
MSMNFDKANMLTIFDESLSRIIKHLDEGHPEKALIRAQETQKAFRKCLGIILQDEQVGRKL